MTDFHAMLNKSGVLHLNSVLKAFSRTRGSFTPVNKYPRSHINLMPWCEGNGMQGVKTVKISDFYVFEPLESKQDHFKKSSAISSNFWLVSTDF